MIEIDREEPREHLLCEKCQAKGVPLVVLSNAADVYCDIYLCATCLRKALALLEPP